MLYIFSKLKRDSGPGFDTMVETDNLLQKKDDEVCITCITGFVMWKKYVSHVSLALLCGRGMYHWLCYVEEVCITGFVI